MLAKFVLYFQAHSDLLHTTSGVDFSMSVSIADLRTLSESSFLHSLDVGMKEIFHAADSEILRLAVESKENSEQNRYLESVQSLRIAHRGVIGEFHGCLLSALGDSSCDSLSSVDRDHISSLRGLMSVDPADWEEEPGRAAMQVNFDKRLKTVADSVDNPLDPHFFTECFLRGLGRADMDVYTKMLVMRLFEEHIYGKLDRFVQQANVALAARGVLPGIDILPGKVDESSRQEKKSVAAPVLPAAAAAAAVPESAGLLPDALADLQANDYEVLDEKLSVEQISTTLEAPPVRDLLSELVAAGLLSEEFAGVPVLQLEQVRMVEKLFDKVVADPNLPVEAHLLLSFLQLPYTRIALADPSFLAEASHPAKMLLNEMIALCADWLPDPELLGNDLLFRKMKAAVLLFVEAERLEQIRYKELLFDFLAVRESRRQKALENSQRLVESHYGASSADRIRAEVGQLLESKMAEATLPDIVQRLLREGWSNVMYICALQKGMDSEEWQAALAVVDLLLDTFRPVEEYLSRADFLLRLPKLLKSLRAGLSSVALPEGLTEELFVGLEKEHKQQAVAIHGDFQDLLRVAHYQLQSADTALVPLFERIGDGASHQPSERKAKMDQSAQQYLDSLRSATPPAIEQPVPVDPVENAEPVQHAIQLGQGASLLWTRKGEQVRCKIAAHIRPLKKYIISDRSGAKIAEISEAEISEKIASGEIETVDSGLVFDRALESVIGGIRGKR